jgi:hypothetical protein
MPEATRQDTQLHIVTNGGNHTIALSYRVPHQKNRDEPPDLYDFLITFLRAVNPQHLIVVGILLVLVINLAFCHHPGEPLQ